MKKFIFLLSLMATVALGTNDAYADPEIEFESEVMEYGTLEKGADGKRVFTFTNIGDAPLIITKCNGSCGCTVPTCPKEPIMPGEKGTIQVKYDTQRVGGFTKTVTVSSNAESGTKVLRIKGTIKAPAAE